MITINEKVTSIDSTRCPIDDSVLKNALEFASPGISSDVVLETLKKCVVATLDNLSKGSYFDFLNKNSKYKEVVLYLIRTNTVAQREFAHSFIMGIGYIESRVFGTFNLERGIATFCGWNLSILNELLSSPLKYVVRRATDKYNKIVGNTEKEDAYRRVILANGTNERTLKDTLAILVSLRKETGISIADAKTKYATWYDSSNFDALPYGVYQQLRIARSATFWGKTRVDLEKVIRLIEYEINSEF